MVPTMIDEQIADLHMKGLNKAKFEKFWEALGIACKTTIEESLHWGVEDYIANF